MDSSRVRAFTLAIGLVGVTAGVACSELATERSMAVFWDNVHWTFAFIVASYLAYLGYRDATGRARTARGYFFASIVAMAVGQFAYDAQVATGWNPFPGPSDLPFLAEGVLAFVGIASHLRDVPRVERIAYALDGLGITLAVLTLTLALYIPHRGEFSDVQAVVLVAYPVVWLGAAGMCVVVMIAHRATASFGRVTVAISALVYGVLWMIWNWRTLEGTLGPSMAAGHAFSYVALSLGVGATQWSMPEERSPRLERVYYLVSSSIPLVLVLIAALALVFGQELGPGAYVAIRICVVLMVVVSAARQSLLLRERDGVISAEKRARETAERFTQLAEGIDDVFVITELPSRRVSYVGPAFEAIWGRPASSVLDGSFEWIDAVHPDDRDAYVQAAGDCAVADFEYRIVRPDGTIRSIRDRRTLIGATDEHLVAAILEDVTEARRASAKNAELTAALARSERLQAIGTLAGGIAHDFNNILAAILANAEIASMNLEGSSPSAKRAIDGILAAGARARDLVRRMLVFARHEEVGVSLVRVESLAQEVIDLLRPVIASSIRLSLEVRSTLPSVSIDPTQLHQVLVNLMTNANHALGGRAGEIAIAIRSLPVAEDQVAGLSVGEYVELAIRDDGRGMDEATRTRVFDPFFTTRRTGEGTGLGLSVAHGIITNHRGTIEVESELGRGTTFRIYLPAHGSEVETTTVASRPPRIGPFAIEREVLLVDDDAMVNESTNLVLASLGIRTVACRSPADALAIVTREPERFALVITDMTMPGMLGDELADALATVAPTLPILLVSGNAEAPAKGRFAAVLPKPFTRDSLARAISGALGIATIATSSRPPASEARPS